MKRFSSTLALSAAALFVAAPARAFTEDVCYPTGGGIAACTPLPAACLPAGTDTPACRSAAALTFATSNATYPDARSTVHVDASYILAQAVGFSATDAYWVAAYSEATDRGSFEPRDETGAVVGGGSLATATVNGLVRTDFNSGGVLIHFSAPRNVAAPAPVAGIDGLHPDPTNPNTEVMLAHLRAWAMAGSGSARPDCAGGLTDPSASGDDATGTTCYASGGAPATISGAVALFDGLSMTPPDGGTMSFSVQTGLQIIQDSDAGTATSDTFDAIVGGGPDHIADARLGVYIHAFGDRISHHVCLDQGYLYGPTDGGTAWQANMTNGQCAQGLHALRHMWETGVDYASLAAEDQTTIAYLGNAYDELVAFATARGVLAASASSSTARSALVADLTAALATSGVAARLAALRGVTCSRGLTPFPGEAACSATSDGGSGDAGAGTGSGAGTAGASGGCSLAGDDGGVPAVIALLAAVGVAGWMVRRQRSTHQPARG